MMLPLLLISLFGIGVAAIKAGSDSKFRLVLKNMSRESADSILSFLSQPGAGKVLGSQLVNDTLQIDWSPASSDAYWIPITKWGQEGTSQLTHYEKI